LRAALISYLLISADYTYSLAGVAHLQPKRAVDGGKPHLNVSSWWRELDRIAQEVPYDLL
jgi:hypothetical protein